MDPTLLHISAKAQQNVTFILHASAIYVPATYIPIICYICHRHKLLNVHQWGSMPIFMPQMISMASTMLPIVQYTNDDNPSSDANDDNTNNNAAQLH